MCRLDRVAVDGDSRTREGQAKIVGPRALEEPTGVVVVEVSQNDETDVLGRDTPASAERSSEYPTGSPRMATKSS